MLVDIYEYQANIRRELSGLEVSAAEFQLEAASQDVLDFLQQSVVVVTDDLITLHGSGTRALVLPELPVIAINEVTVAGTVVDDFTVDYDRAILYRTRWCGWPRGYHNITVDYDHGYGTVEQDSDGAKTAHDEIPYNIRRVVIELAKLGYDQIQRVGDVQSETAGPFSKTYATFATNDQQGRARIMSTLARRAHSRVPVA